MIGWHNERDVASQVLARRVCAYGHAFMNVFPPPTKRTEKEGNKEIRLCNLAEKHSQGHAAVRVTVGMPVALCHSLRRCPSNPETNLDFVLCESGSV